MCGSFWLISDIFQQRERERERERDVLSSKQAKRNDKQVAIIVSHFLFFHHVAWSPKPLPLFLPFYPIVQYRLRIW